VIHVRCEDRCIELCFSRVPNRLSRILVAKSHGRRRTTLCTGAAAFDAPHTHTHQSKPSLPLRTLDDTTPTPTSKHPTRLRLCFNFSCYRHICCNQKIVIDHTSIRQRVFPHSGAHSYATCALPRQQRRPPSGAKIAIHHHRPFLRRIARL
jgi:hypothetical protein